MSEQIVPFVADVDAAFIALREDMRSMLREAETLFREEIERDFRKNLAPDLAAAMCPMIPSLPAIFVRGLYAFFKMQSDMLDAADELNEQLRRSRATIQ